ncbi:helicase-like protein, partial [Trifolium medium]|nr:helicase-like protein [Trifolium medium]
VWRHDTIGGYSVRDEYPLLTAMEAPDVGATSDLIWHKQVPLKVSVLAWRLFKNSSTFVPVASTSLGLGLVFRQLIRTCYRITLSSLYILLDDCELATFSCSLLVMLHFGYVE